MLLWGILIWSDDMDISNNSDKHKEIDIFLKKSHLLKLSKEVIIMAENDPELLNTVYKEISEKLGMDTAMEVYQMFKGQQISFPVRVFNPERIQKIIVQEYTVKLFAKQDTKVVNIFVVNPKITLFENGEKVPHLYSDGSLCLFYPKYNELSYTDLWTEALIPWTSLWLFYYEIWKETGEWLGGGIHGKKNISPTGL